MSNKEVILMLYPTRAEATMGFDRVFVAMKDPKIAVRKSDMIETADVRIHFHSISSHYYSWIKGFRFNQVWFDERIDANAILEDGLSLMQMVQSRKIVGSDGSL